MRTLGRGVVCLQRNPMIILGNDILNLRRNLGQRFAQILHKLRIILGVIDVVGDDHLAAHFFAHSCQSLRAVGTGHLHNGNIGF